MIFFCCCCCYIFCWFHCGFGFILVSFQKQVPFGIVDRHRDRCLHLHLDLKPAKQLGLYVHRPMFYSLKWPMTEQLYVLVTTELLYLHILVFVYIYVYIYIFMINHPVHCINSIRNVTLLSGGCKHLVSLDGAQVVQRLLGDMRFYLGIFVGRLLFKYRLAFVIANENPDVRFCATVILCMVINVGICRGRWAALLNMIWCRRFTRNV